MKQKSYASDYEPVRRVRRAHSAWWDEAEQQQRKQRDVTTLDAEEVWPARGASADASAASQRTNGVEATAESVESVPTGPKASGATRPEKWIEKRGHALGYAGLFLYTIALYFRPYEWHPSLYGLINLSFWFALFTLAVFVPTQLALENRLTVRTREVNCVLLLCVLALVSMVPPIDRAVAWSYFSDVFAKIVIMFIVMVNVARTEWRLKGLMLLALVAGCVTSWIAIVDYRTGNFGFEGYRVGTLNHGMFSNPDDVGLHLVMMIPITIALMLSSRSLLKKLIYGAATLLMTAGTIFTFSRGAFLGLLGAVVVLGWKFGRRNKLVFFALFFLFLVVFLIFAPGHYATRLLSIFDHSLDPVGSASARQALLLRSTYIMLRHPLLGVGFNNFPIYSLQGKLSHNSYTQVGAELGIPALVVYVTLMVSSLKHLGRIERETYQTRRDSQFYGLAIGLQASMVAYIITSFFISVAFGWNVYYLVGYAICLRRLYETQKPPVVAPAKQRSMAADAVNENEGLAVRNPL
ncbi:MAG TPA: O-antigen ligase family protein [Pyrinomonadaceae bacterium]|jgi:O-antigen ligase